MAIIGIKKITTKKYYDFFYLFEVMPPSVRPPWTSSLNLPRMESSLPTISSFSVKSSTKTNATGSEETPQSNKTPDKSTSPSRVSRGTLTIHAVTTTSARPVRGESSIDVNSAKPGAAEGSHGTAPPATTTKAAEGSHGTTPPATTTKAAEGSQGTALAATTTEAAEGSYGAVPPATTTKAAEVSQGTALAATTTD